MPMFIIFAGLPGTGKSAIARQLARELGAVYIRIDTIEQAIRSSPGSADVGPAGYMAAYRLAADNLGLGRTVIADSVNPLEITREAYRRVALEAEVGFLDVEVICSDSEIHRQRVETRRSEIKGLVPPTWDEVQSHRYEAWDRPHLAVDSAALSVAEGVDAIIVALAAAGSVRS